MPDRFKYSEVRQKIINALRTDLMGPQSENEILDENPKSSYIIGMLASQTEEKEASTAGEQEVDSDIAYGDSEDYTAGEDDDNEPIMTTSFKLPTSIGICVLMAIRGLSRSMWFQLPPLKTHRSRQDAFMHDNQLHSFLLTGLKLVTVSSSMKYPLKMILSESMLESAHQVNP